jgi:hypothetical protein
MSLKQKLDHLKKNSQWKCDDRWERRAADKVQWATLGGYTDTHIYSNRYCVRYLGLLFS